MATRLDAFANATVDGELGAELGTALRVAGAASIGLEIADTTGDAIVGDDQARGAGAAIAVAQAGLSSVARVALLAILAGARQAVSINLAFAPGSILLAGVGGGVTVLGCAVGVAAANATGVVGFASPASIVASVGRAILVHLAGTALTSFLANIVLAVLGEALSVAGASTSKSVL